MMSQRTKDKVVTALQAADEMVGLADAYLRLDPDATKEWHEVLSVREALLTATLIVSVLDVTRDDQVEEVSQQ